MKLLMVAETHLTIEKIKELESEVAVFKGVDVSSPTSLQLESSRQKIDDLKARLMRFKQNTMLQRLRLVTTYLRFRVLSVPFRSFVLLAM